MGEQSTQNGPNDPPVKRGRDLPPFTSETGRAAAARSADVRRARAARRRQASADIARDLAALVAAHDRSQLGPVAAAAAQDMIGRVTRGEVTVRDPAEWVRVLVDVARIEEGQHTSAALVAHLGSDDTAARVAALQTSARAALARVNGSPITTAMGEGASVNEQHEHDTRQ